MVTITSKILEKDLGGYNMTIQDTINKLYDEGGFTHDQFKLIEQIEEEADDMDKELTQAIERIEEQKEEINSLYRSQGL